jgi:EmrB/QacA subfamily drug resistance transporter
MTAPSTTVLPPETLPAMAVSANSSPSQSTRPSSGRAGLVLAAACVCQLMVVLDISVVNVALPDIGRSLGFSPSSLSWVVSAYTLTFGGLLLLGGRVADLIGHRRTMLGALALFGIASVLGGFTHSPDQLIAARAAQGMTAAVLSPLTLTVIMVNVPEGPQRRRALATWGMVATGGSALGVLLSGLLTQYLDWRWVLFVNVPFVLVAATLALVGVRDLRISKPVRLDIAGAILATASTTLLAYGCVNAGEHGWDSAMTLSALGGAVLAGMAFVGRQQRAEAPLIRLSVLRTRAVWVATVIIAFIGTATVAGFYFASLSLQNVMRYDPVTTGLAFLPFCAGMAAATMASSSLVERFGPRIVVTLGLTVAAVGMLGFTRLHVGAGFPTFLLASIPASTGLGVCIAPTLSLGTTGALRPEAGMVSGVLNTSRQVGGSLALAVFTTIASRASHRAGQDLQALAHGYGTAFLLSGALLFAAAAVAGLFVPSRKTSAPKGEPGS